MLSGELEKFRNDLRTAIMRGEKVAFNYEQVLAELDKLDAVKGNRIQHESLGSASNVCPTCRRPF